MRSIDPHGDCTNEPFSRNSCRERNLLISIVGATIVWSIGLLLVNTLPLIFQVIEGRSKVNESALGALGALFVLGTALIISSGPLWIERANWRWVSIGGLIAASAAVIAAMLASDFTVLAFCFFVMGVSAGVVQTPAFAVLGNSRDPVRAFSIALFVSMLLPAILSIGVPAKLIVSDGGLNLLGVIAVIFVVAVPFAWVLPGKHRKSVTDISTGVLPASPLIGAKIRLRDYGAATAAPIVASVAGGLFTGVIMAIYAFVGSIAVANGISPEVTGTLLGLGLIGALGGALLPAVVEKWIKPTSGIGIAVVALILAYPALLSNSPKVFTTAFVFHCVFATAGFAYFLAMVRSIDPTHRIYVGYPAVKSAGIAGATVAAGALLTNFNPATLFIFAGSCLIASWLLWLFALRLSARFPGNNLR